MFKHVLSLNLFTFHSFLFTFPLPFRVIFRYNQRPSLQVWDRLKRSCFGRGDKYFYYDHEVNSALDIPKKEVYNYKLNTKGNSMKMNKFRRTFSFLFFLFLFKYSEIKYTVY